MPTNHTARQIAVQVLAKVDEAGAYANIELDKRLRASSLEARDRGLATELVYGTLRWRAALDRSIQAASDRNLSQLSPIIRSVLRVTAYQMLYLAGIPSHAAVHEGVEIAKKFSNKGAAGFVNAVARRVQRTGLVPAAAGRPAKFLSEAWSHPEWLVERWVKHYGEEATEALLKANQQPAPLVLRVNTLRVSRHDCLQAFLDAGVKAEPGATPASVIVANGVSVPQLPGYKEGHFVVQDESSQLVALAANPQPGDFVVDLCSAPGGKATHAAQLMNNTGTVVASELHAHRANLVARTASRLGLTSISVVNQDSREVPATWRDHADRVMLDAPCTGTGVLRRRVDLRWRLRPEHVSELVALQRELLAAAAAIVRPGGTLVYSTCSIEREENHEQVESFLQHYPHFVRGSLSFLASLVPTLVPSTGETQGELQLLPDEAGTDGFFLAVLVRKSQT